MKLNTCCLVLLLKDNQISLGMKKRGFGAGRWNGYGGKPQIKETIKQSATRETLEECGVKIIQLEQKALLKFYFSDKPEWNQQAIVFISTQWMGEPVESEEMKPKWFEISQIPYTDMWPDDTFWLPKVLNGEFVKAKFTLDSSQKLLKAKVNGENLDVN